MSPFQQDTEVDEAEADDRPAMRGRGGRSGGRGGGRGGGRSGGRSGRGGGGFGMFGGRGRALAAHKFVTGTPFVVDGFTEGPKPGRLYFLTHFHADHYGGLSRRWAEASQNKIFCSAITARLVVKRLGVPESKVERLPMGAEVPVCVGQTRATVQLVDANHCPGAVLLIFRLAGGKVVLHTGDFRFAPSVGACLHAALNGSPLDVLYLDTTYCHRRHAFPSQESVVRSVISRCQLLRESKRTLVLFGAYTIGKERVFLEAARQVGFRLHVSAARLSTLACLELSAEDMARFTTDASATRWAVVPMGHLRFDRMRALLKSSNGRYTAVVGFRPTGWVATSSTAGGTAAGRTLRAGPLQLYELPYSEHSSFAELQACVRQLKPRLIVPTVGSAADTRAQVAMLQEPGAAPVQAATLGHPAPG